MQVLLGEGLGRRELTPVLLIPTLFWKLGGWRCHCAIANAGSYCRSYLEGGAAGGRAAS